MSAATILSIINTAKSTILTPLITLLIISATVIFIWGIIKYISAAHDSKKIGEAKNRMKAGVIGLIIILGAAVLTNFILDMALKATA